MRLLLVAADPMEFAGILSRSEQPRPAGLALDWARSARLGGNEVLLAANGVGWKRAAAAVDAGVSFRPDAVVSTGFCGALNEELEIADIVVGTAVTKLAGDGAQSIGMSSGQANTSVCAMLEPAIGPPSCVRSGPICSIDHVAQTSEEKRRLGTSGACAVEMEAAGVAERASALGLPFHCLRVVTDLAGETMANNYNECLRPDGHFDTMLILRRSLRHPTVRLPELLRLRNRCVRAARVLGEFFANCRF